jgi:hypothetical protein
MKTEKKIETRPAGAPLAKGQKVRLDEDGYIRPAAEGEKVHGTVCVDCTTNAVVDVEIG